MSATLFEIRDDLNALADLLAEVGGDVTEADAEAAIDAWLAETEGATKAKLDSYAALIREVETRAAGRKAEAERLAALAKADSGTVDRLKARLLWFMQDQQLDKVETERFRLTVCANGGKPPVRLLVPPETLPAEYRREKVIVSADTDTIREALEKGADLPFASLGERGVHLRIR